MSTSTVCLNMLNLIHCFQQIHNFYSPPLSLCSLTPCIQYFYLFCLHSQNISCLMPNFDIDQSHIVTFGISLLEQLMH